MAQLIFLNDIADRNQYGNPKKHMYDYLTDFKFGYYVYLNGLDISKTEFFDWLIENGTGMVLVGSASGNYSINVYSNSEQLNFAIEMRFVSDEPNKDAVRVMKIDYRSNWADEQEPFWSVV